MGVARRGRIEGYGGAGMAVFMIAKD